MKKVSFELNRSESECCGKIKEKERQADGDWHEENGRYADMETEEDITQRNSKPQWKACSTDDKLLASNPEEEMKDFQKFETFWF